jgi:GNAT superfamily N-acetyltransferase
MSSSHNGDFRRANARIAAVWKTMERDHTGADFSEDDLVRRWADSALPFLNVVLVSEATADKKTVSSCLQRAAEYMRRQSRPGVIFVCQGLLQPIANDELAEIIAASGLRQGPLWMEMVGHASAMASATHPALRITRIVDEAGVRTLADINSTAYGLPLEAGRDGILRAHELYTTSYSFAAYCDDKPVAACSYLVQDGCLYLAWVATSPDEQRKGYASAVVSHALRQAHLATGIEPTDLHATEAGAPVYERLGYRRAIPFQHLYLAE